MSVSQFFISRQNGTKYSQCEIKLTFFSVELRHFVYGKKMANYELVMNCKTEPTLDGIIHFVPGKLSFYLWKDKSQSPHEPLMAVLLQRTEEQTREASEEEIFAINLRPFEGKLLFICQERDKG